MTAKLAFAFPTQPKPGYVMGRTPPEINFTWNETSGESFLILTVGVVDMDDNQLYSLLMQVFKDDKEVTIAPKEEKETSTYHQLTGKNGEVVSYISLTDRFTMASAGTYRILLKLVSKARNKDPDWKTIHELETYFSVSSGWES